MWLTIKFLKIFIIKKSNGGITFFSPLSFNEVYFVQVVSAFDSSVYKYKIYGGAIEDVIWNHSVFTELGITIYGTRTPTIQAFKTNYYIIIQRCSKFTSDFTVRI